MEFTSTQIDYARLQQSKLNFSYKTRKNEIFHYTSIGGLEGILGNKKLRFTNIKYMNDKDEIIAGLDSLAKVFHVSEEKREQMHSAFMNLGIETFVCCFSLEEDSLPLWNYYTKEINNQGYNIEFDDKKLVESILRNNPLLDGCSFSFGVVDYSKDNNSKYWKTFKKEVLTSMDLLISKLFLTVAKGALNNPSSKVEELSLKELEEKIVESEKKRKLDELPIYFYNGEKCSFEKDVSGEYLYFIKREYFKQEREFRIVITVPDKHLKELREKGVYKFRIGNGILIPFLELNFSADVVKSITISPTAHSDLVESSIEDFLKYSKFEVKDYSKFIRHSNVPVRF